MVTLALADSLDRWILDWYVGVLWRRFQNIVGARQLEKLEICLKCGLDFRTARRARFWARELRYGYYMKNGRRAHAELNNTSARA